MNKNFSEAFSIHKLVPKEPYRGPKSRRTLLSFLHSGKMSIILSGHWPTDHVDKCQVIPYCSSIRSFVLSDTFMTYMGSWELSCRALLPWADRHFSEALSASLVEIYVSGSKRNLKCSWRTSSFPSFFQDFPVQVPSLQDTLGS